MKNLKLNISNFLSINNCPNCNSSISPNKICQGCQSFVFMPKAKAIAFYTHNDAFTVINNNVISYKQFDKNYDSINLSDIILAELVKPMPNLNNIFHIINKINVLQ